MTNDRATQKRKENNSESCPNDELFKKVRNNDVYKEFMKLQPGKMKFYDSRNYVRGNAADLMGPRGASNCYIFNRRPAERCCGQIWHSVVKQEDTYSYVISTGTRKLELTTL